MPSTYSNSLRLELQADNENQGNWGSITNRNLGTLLESSISGVRSITLPDTDYTLTALNGSDDEARYAYLIFSGTLTATRNVIVPTPSKLYAVRNATNQSIVIKTATGTGVTVPSGMSTLAYSNGANVLDTLSYVSNLSGNGAGLFSLNASNLASGTIPEARFPASLPSLSGANLTNLNASNLASGIVPDARFPATLPAISGANLTNLNASNLASGTVPDARFPATLPAISGANLTNLNANNLASGTVPFARLTGSYAISITGNAATATNQSGGTVNATSISGTSISVSGTSSLAGRTVSDAANANTLVTRDGNNHSFFNYIHSNTGNSENPGVSQVIVTNGGDGFFRKASIGHLTASLSGTAPINITGNAATASNGGVTSVNAGAGISVNQTTGSVTITNTRGSVFTVSAESGDFVPNGSSQNHTFSHGLGVTPKKVIAYARNIVAVDGYSVGDLVFWTSFDGDGSRQISVGCNATTAWFSGPPGQNLTLGVRAGNTGTGFIATHWRFRVVVFA